MEGQVFLSEGNSLIVNCSYETKQYPALFWYVQYPREGPQLLFRVARAGEKGSHKGFEATYSKETTSFHLEKASVHESDSAVYYCALGDTVAETTGEAEHKLSSTGAWLQGVCSGIPLVRDEEHVYNITTHPSPVISLRIQ
jgi:T cell receptor alpha chain V region